MRLERAAIVGVPILAGAVTAAVILGPGRARPVDGVRIRALVAEGAAATSLEVTTIRHEAGQRRPIALDGLIVALDGASGSARWEGATDARGHADANLVLPGPAKGDLAVRVSGPLAAEGRLALRPPLAPVAAPPTFVEGEPRLSVWLPRGFAVPEMPETLVVTAATGAREPTPHLAVQAEGAEIAAPEAPESTCDDGCVHTWRLRVVATANAAQVTATVTIGADTTRWEGTLPLAPGRLWLDPDGETRGWRIVAPHPIDVAHVALLGPGGRLWATAVAMHVDDRGFATGTVEPPQPSPPGPGPRAVALASDLDADPARWPLPPYGAGHLPPAGRPEVVVDTLPEAIAAEAARAERTRRPAYALILAASLFELVFLAHRARRSSRRLQRHLDEYLPQGVAARLEIRSPLWWLSVFTFALVLAFVALAGLAAFAG